MNIQEVIAKKRDKKELSEEEINFFVHEYTKREYNRLSSISLNNGNIY